MTSTVIHSVDTSTMDKVTVDKAYFDALLRRADFHTTTQLLGQGNPPADITVSRVEYDILHRRSREYDALKAALIQGGVTVETLELLVASARADGRRDSQIDSWSGTAKCTDTAHPLQTWKTTGYTGASYKVPSAGAHNDHYYPTRPVGSQRQWSAHGSGADDQAVDYDDDVSLDGDVNVLSYRNNQMDGKVQDPRTIYFAGLSERTTYKDLLSIVKGGKILSVLIRGSGATVSFYEGAADFLAWAKRNDIYVSTKRVEVRWAERQFRMNSHVGAKVAAGATRNMVIRSALDKGLSESRIREDMEHIHNLVIVDVTFRKSDAFVSINSVHNALYARTCMMSRITYRGCKIEFVADECDVPLPQRRTTVPFVQNATSGKTISAKKTPLQNRFGILNIDGTEANSDEENRAPSDDGSEN